jgi:hypothetical protein
MSGDAELEKGRESFERQAWAPAYAQLSAADLELPLQPQDLAKLRRRPTFWGEMPKTPTCGRVPIRNSWPVATLPKRPVSVSTWPWALLTEASSPGAAAGSLGPCITGKDCALSRLAAGSGGLTSGNRTERGPIPGLSLGRTPRGRVRTRRSRAGRARSKSEPCRWYSRGDPGGSTQRAR